MFDVLVDFSVNSQSSSLRVLRYLNLKSDFCIHGKKELYYSGRKDSRFVLKIS